jgi:hypothetical protein
MQQHVGVAMADELPIVRHVDAADPQRPAGLRAMTILPESNPQLACNRCSFGVCPHSSWEAQGLCLPNE